MVKSSAEQEASAQVAIDKAVNMEEERLARDTPVAPQQKASPPSSSLLSSLELSHTQVYEP